MEKSGYYDFFSNMWIMRRIDKDYLDNQVIKGRITQNEKNMILDLTQMEK